MDFLVFIANLAYRIGLPMPAFSVFSFERFLWSRPSRIKSFLIRVHPDLLWKIAETKLLFVLKMLIKDTPALKDIKKRYFPEQNIKSVKDFSRLFPILDKDTYRKRYSLEELNRGGKLPPAGSFYKSAGTSGKPTLWTESISEEMSFERGVSFIAETMLDMRLKEYAILNCWALGSWPTGIIFFTAARFHGKVLNVGTNLPEALDALQMLGPRYSYLLAGYPPFLFHLLEDCEKNGIDLSKYHIDVVSGGEGFVEKWRDQLIKKLGNKRTIFSVYGSTDKGLGEGLETNLAYIIRSLLYAATVMLTDEQMAREIMRERFSLDALPFNRESAREFLLAFLKREDNLKRLPMVFQFDPTVFYNENLTFMDPQHNREVNEFITTTLSPFVSIPRVRYNIHDEGFILKFQEVKGILQKYGIIPETYNIRGDDSLELRLPFLFLFGRSDGTVSVDGANIFPQNAEECLRENQGLLQKTNTFQLFVSENYHLGLAFELREGTSAESGLSERYRAYFRDNFSRFSSGYEELVHDHLPSADLVVEVHPYGTGPFRERTIKLRYVKQ